MSAEDMSRGSTARDLSTVREDRGEVRRRLDRLRAELVEMETEMLALSRLLETVAIDPERPLRNTASKRVDVPKTWSISPSVTLPIASPTPSRPSGTS